MDVVERRRLCKPHPGLPDVFTAVYRLHALHRVLDEDKKEVLPHRKAAWFLAIDPSALHFLMTRERTRPKSAAKNTTAAVVQHSFSVIRGKKEFFTVQTSEEKKAERNLENEQHAHMCRNNAIQGLKKENFIP